MEGLSSKLSRVGGTGSGAALLRAPVPLQLLSRGPGGAWAVSTVPPSVLGPREPLHPSKGTIFPHFLLPVAREKMSPPPAALRLYFPPGPRRSSEIPDSLMPLPLDVLWAGSSPFPPARGLGSITLIDNLLGGGAAQGTSRPSLCPLGLHRPRGDKGGTQEPGPWEGAGRQ